MQRRTPRAPLALLLAALAGAPSPLLALGAPVPVQPGDPALEGRPVRNVEIFQPVPGEAGELAVMDGPLRQLALNQIRTVPGSMYSAAVATQDLARLDRLGRFGLTELRTLLLDDGAVEVRFILSEQPTVRDVQITGNRRVTTADIAERVEFLQGTAVDQFQLDRGARLIEGIYQEKGYASVSVSWDPEELKQGILLYRVIEGERVRVMDIRFEGNAAFSASELRSKIKTETWSILNRAPLNEDRLEEDIFSLVQFYQDRGYLDVEVDRLPPRLSPDGREAIVTFVINEGPVYTFRSVKVFYPDGVRELTKTSDAAERSAQPGEEFLATGPGEYAVYSTSPFSSAQIAGLMLLKRGDVYSVGQINASMRKIEEAFANLGFQDVREGGRLDRRELRDPANPQLVDVLLFIRPGEKKLTGEVSVVGNDITKADVVRRTADLQPDRPLDWTEVREAERRIQRSPLFARDFRSGQPMSSVTIQNEDEDFPGYRDILLEVTETSTAEFNFGGSVNSDSGFVGRLSYTQRNFDITDFPDTFSEFIAGRSFRGGGQIFSIELLPGTEIQTYSVSLTEPSLFDTNYQGGGTIFYRVREYDDYDENRLSARLTARRSFGRRWVGSAQVRFDDITLDNIVEDAPTDVFDLEGSNELATASFTLTRSTLDASILPSRGVRVSLGAEQAGLLGDFTYTRFRAENQIYLPLFTDMYGRNTILSFDTEIGYIPQGNDDVPVFERFYRGGTSFRGFGHRAVAPRGIRADNGEESDDTVGGSWEFFHSIEVVQPLYEELLYGAAFVDMGTVTDEVGFDDFRLSVGVGLRIVIPAIGPAPIALDFGFPLMKEDGDDTQLFTFTIDLPF